VNKIAFLVSEMYAWHILMTAYWSIVYYIYIWNAYTWTLGII